MYKNIKRYLAIGILSVVCLLLVGCGPGIVNPPRYYNNNGYGYSGYSPYYAGTSGYYWATPNNRYWNNNYYHNGYYGGSPFGFSVGNRVGYYGGDRDDYYRGGYGGDRR